MLKICQQQNCGFDFATAINQVLKKHRLPKWAGNLFPVFNKNHILYLYPFVQTNANFFIHLKTNFKTKFYHY